MNTDQKTIIEDDQPKQATLKCDHYMCWNLQGGYSYHRCMKCDYIDGEKTFATEKQKAREECALIAEGDDYYIFLNNDMETAFDLANGKYEEIKRIRKQARAEVAAKIRSLQPKEDLSQLEGEKE